MLKEDLQKLRFLHVDSVLLTNNISIKTKGHGAKYLHTLKLDSICVSSSSLSIIPVFPRVSDYCTGDVNFNEGYCPEQL
jgi:hypothetical protein